MTRALDQIGSDAASSGAGVAAALALALAVACALKAVNVSLKHREDGRLEGSRERLRALRDGALGAAQLDATLFEVYLAEHDPRDAARLVIAAEGFQELAVEIEREVSDLASIVVPTVASDLSAANALLAAAVQIEGRILRDNRRLRARATL